MIPSLHKGTIPTGATPALPCGVPFPKLFLARLLAAIFKVGISCSQTYVSSGMRAAPNSISLPRLKSIKVSVGVRPPAQ